MNIFTGIKKYTDGAEDLLVLFDGNVVIGTIKKYESERFTGISIARIKRPKGLKRGDHTTQHNLVKTDGISFIFEMPEDLDVLISKLTEVKKDMEKHVPSNQG